MEFDNEVQRTAHQTVKKLMSDLFGQPHLEHPGAFIYLAADPGGDADHPIVIRLFIAPLGDDAAVTVRCPVVDDVEVTPELTHYLLRANDDLFYASFGLDSNENVVCDRSIAASTCSQEELRQAVTEVASTAHQYSEEIRARFGGVKPTVGRAVEITP